MEFIGLKIAGFVLWTAFAWYIGRKWEQYNSVSDVATQFAKAKDAVTKEVTTLEASIEAAKTKAETLKTLLPH